MLRTKAAGLLLASIWACTSAQQKPATSSGPLTPGQIVTADSGRPAYTRADVGFMQGMIHHHAQAVLMSRWAPTHNASEELRILASRIDVAQRDEIAFMQRWLRERRELAPDVQHMIAGHQMSGMVVSDTSARHMVVPDTLMPGMLTADQMKQLDATRGAEFDRLFLTFMIQHHQGALTMVQQLFSSPGAGQDTYVWKFASDVEADQSTEIARMQSMLNTSDGRRQ